MRRNHRRPSTLMAADDCVRGRAAAGSRRATRQHGHQQFHCGKPPPAALPSRITYTCEGEGGRARAAAPPPGPTYFFVATYAVTSNVTATTVNSGFVQAMFPPRQVHRGCPPQTPASEMGVRPCIIDRGSAQPQTRHRSRRPAGRRGRRTAGTEARLARNPPHRSASCSWLPAASNSERGCRHSPLHIIHICPSHSLSPGFLGADTDAESERRQIERWRAMSPAEKLQVVAELNAAADTMALAGIRLRHPGASPREQFLWLASVKLGRDLARQVYPEIEQLDAQ